MMYQNLHIPNENNQCYIFLQCVQREYKFLVLPFFQHSSYRVTQPHKSKTVNAFRTCQIILIYFKMSNYTRRKVVFDKIQKILTMGNCWFRCSHVLDGKISETLNPPCWWMADCLIWLLQSYSFFPSSQAKHQCSHLFEMENVTSHTAWKPLRRNWRCIFFLSRDNWPHKMFYMVTCT